MNVIAHLFAFVSKHLVGLALQVALDEVAEETVEFDAAVIRPGQAPAAQTARLHAEIASVLLDHDVAGRLGGAKKAVLTLVNWEILPDAIRVGSVLVIPTGR